MMTTQVRPSLMTMIRALDEELTGVMEVDRRAEVIGHLRQRTDRLTEAAEKVERSYAVIDLLTARGIENALEPVPQLLVEALQDAKRASTEDPTSAGTGAAPAILMLLESHAQTVEGAARLSSARWRGAHRPPDIDEDLLLVADQADGTLRHRFEEATARIEKLREETKLPTAEDLERWLETVEALRQIQDKAAESADSPAVIAFYKSVQSPGGALLETALDDDVISHLRSRGTVSKYRVVPVRDPA